MPEKRWIPQVLWRLFGNRARTLASAIVALLPYPPPSPAECPCKGLRCLGCSGSDAMSFLLRPEDPDDYLKLLNRCFIVVPDDEPALSYFHPHCRWSQAQIVQRAIEMKTYDKVMSSNVVCDGYDKVNHSSPIMELLSSSAWCLLLQRVGDDVMFYLLNHTSVFLPLPNKKHRQVAGPPISKLCYEFSKRRSESQYPHTSLIHCGSKKQRPLVEDHSSLSVAQKLSSSPSVDDPSSSVSWDGSNASSVIRSFTRLYGEKHSRMNLSNADTAITGTGTHDTRDLDDEFQECSNQIAEKSRKRSRPFSWQRCRKRRHLKSEETSVKTSFATSRYKDGFSQGLRRGGIASLSHPGMMPWECSCSLGVQAPQSLVVAKGAHINRQSMFYDLQSYSSVFPRKHILSSLKPNFSDAKFLIGNIYGVSELNAGVQSAPSFPISGFNLTGYPCLYKSLVKFLKSLIRRTHGCQHFRLLDKHCVVPAVNSHSTGKSCIIVEGDTIRKNISKNSCGFDAANCEETLPTIRPQFAANKSYCSKTQVVSFIWAVIRSVVPPELLGTTYNWRMLRRNIAKFICLRRFEKFSLKQCMHKLKTSRFPFLSTLHLLPKGLTKLKDATNILKHYLLQSWIFWLFSCLVVPLVQANFYVTETEHGDQEVYYYRKSVWEKLMNRAITCLKDQNYLELDVPAVRNIISKRLFGFSKLRLRPKENGVRMLANLKASSRLPAQESSLEDQSFGMRRKGKFNPKKVKYNHFKSVNCVIRDTYAVLKGLQLEEPEMLGSSVFDYNEVYRKLCPFFIGLKNGSTIMPRIFVVVSDVLKAFDSVDQDKLLSVMNDIILNDKYLLRQSDQVVCTKKNLWVHKNLVSVNQNIGITRVKSSVPFRSLHSVLVNQEWSRYVKKEELFFTLKEHVKFNVLQFNKKFYLQGLGIPQGSILSSLLCSLYFGHLERNVIFPFLEKTCECTAKDLPRGHIYRDASEQESSVDKFDSPLNYILLRFIDDFLLISTSKKQATSFFSRLQRGFRNYNCFMNDDKYGLNFDNGCISGVPSNRVSEGEDGISFLRWSGLLINCCTLEVQADYTKYLNKHLSSTLTVCWQGKPGRNLKEKLCGFIRPKCHPLFFDSNINSAAVVRLNMYQAFLLCAMKFHCYVRELSYICKLRTGFYVSIIERSLRYGCTSCYYLIVCVVIKAAVFMY
ncbi:hypothetical protein I3842_13G004200 [Carya illinoinensis]|uniref:Telomerase reverse transcriptase n=1 Tax=Carya illinoinensis TaxID=32201 RepID=A0A922AM78_CARIL|nr:hypothetical protein I3842_13G004200 [Carya illinoinensis]